MIGRCVACLRRVLFWKVCGRCLGRAYPDRYVPAWRDMDRVKPWLWVAVLWPVVIVLLVGIITRGVAIEIWRRFLQRRRS